MAKACGDVQDVRWQSANAETIAALVDLSASEVRELLGEPESGCAASDVAEKLAALLSRCEALLSPGGCCLYHSVQLKPKSALGAFTEGLSH